MSGRAPTKFEAKGDPAHVTRFWNHETKAMVMIEAPVPDRRYVAGDVGDLARLVTEFAGRAAATDGTEAAPVFVWVYEGSVVVVLDETGTRRERITLKLTEADGFAALKANDGVWLPQKGMIELLRTSIDGEYVPPNIVATFRKLKFTASSEGNAEIRVGRANLGKSVEAAVAGIDGDLPEDLTITLPLYDDLLDPQDKASVARRFQIVCSVDVNLAEEKIRIDTKAGQIARAVLDADTFVMTRLGELIKGENVRIFRGKPE